MLAATPARAGEFDRLEGDALAHASQRHEDAKRHESLSFRAAHAEQLTPVLSDTRAAFLVVKTGQGNYTRILATPALRKPPGGEGEPVPVIVLDKFDTFEPGKSGSRLARGAGLILFEGFQVDLDTGHVVPSGQGGDLELRKEDREPPRLGFPRRLDALHALEAFTRRPVDSRTVARQGDRSWRLRGPLSPVCRRPMDWPDGASGKSPPIARSRVDFDPEANGTYRSSREGSESRLRFPRRPSSRSSSPRPNSRNTTAGSGPRGKTCWPGRSRCATSLRLLRHSRGADLPQGLATRAWLLS